MGNRSRLIFGNVCEFEANNCLPIPWLALFRPEEFFIEEDPDEESTMIGYRTDQRNAFHRINLHIDMLRRDPVWKYLRTEEIFRDELAQCAPETDVQVDMTEFAFIDEAHQELAKQAIRIYQEEMEEIIINEDGWLSRINQLVNRFALGNISSLSEITDEERMFVLFGMYWGDPEKEEKYSLEYFNAAYWNS
jgi:hypothetical protein